MARHTNPFHGAGGGGRRDTDPRVVWQQAVAAQQAGRFAQAEKLFKQFLKASGPRPDALRALAIAQSQQGRHLEAIKSIERACKAAPDNTQLRTTHASVLLQAGRADEARKIYEQLLRQKAEPGGADWFHVAIAQRAAGRREQACESFERSLGLEPRMLQAHHEYATLLHELGAVDAAFEHATLCTGIDPKQLAGWLTLGGIERSRGNHGHAVECFRKAVDLQPGFAGAHSNLGQALLEAGDREAAEQSFERALELDPDNGAIRVMLAAARKLGERSTETAWMEKAAKGKGPRPGPGSPTGLHDYQFAWSKMLRDLGDEDAAFAWLHKANATKRKGLRYEVDGDLAWLSRIANTFTAEVLAAAADAGGCDDSTPVFVCGMPRSGTTLVESLLDAHPEVVGAGEPPYLPEACAADPLLAGDREPLGAATAPAETLRRVGEEYLRRLRRHAPEARLIVDKLPGNAVRIGAIRRMLPAARIICMRRDPRDVGLSNYRVSFDSGQHWSYDLRDIGRYQRAHETLVDHFVGHVEAGALLEVHYEQLVDDFEAQVRRICDFLGLEFDAGMLRFHERARGVTSASLLQVRSPVHSGSVGGWRAHAEELAPLLEALDTPEAPD